MRVMKMIIMGVLFVLTASRQILQTTFFSMILNSPRCDRYESSLFMPNSTPSDRSIMNVSTHSTLNSLQTSGNLTARLDFGEDCSFVTTIALCTLANAASQASAVEEKAVFASS